MPRGPNGNPLGRGEASERTVASAGAREQLVIVGNGMVAHHFCERLIAAQAGERFRIVVFGQEPMRAYDRVQLSRVIDGEEPSYLCPEDFHARHGIELHLGEGVESCDLERRLIRTAAREVRFDKLVFATGSRPLIPKGLDADSPRVACLRDVGDAVRVRRWATLAAQSEIPVVIIGAGLLGFEAAHQLKTLGCRVVLIESAPHLLPRQLDPEAAERLLGVVLGAGFAVRVGARVAGLERDDASVQVVLDDGERVHASFVLIAAGVRPCDELARQAGIRCDLFGGIEVNDALETSAEGVFAVGECARHRGISHGLLAPGRQMAEVLAARLAGSREVFRGSQPATRLELPGVEITAMGQSNVRDLSTTHVTRVEGDSFRKLVLRRGRLVGLVVIGSWQELDAAQAAVALGAQLRRRRLDAFRAGAPAFSGPRPGVRSWPPSATVCVCTGVTAGALVRAHREGCDTVERLCRATGAASVCGSCRPLVASVTEAAPPPAFSGAERLATLALLAVGSVLLAPAIPHVPSVQVPVRWDFTFGDELGKQLSGCGFLALMLLGLTLSLRKRSRWLSRFSQGQLRTFHIGVGVGTVIAFAVHTGLRLGANLDRVLAVAFLVSSLLGALAALWPALVRRRASLARFKLAAERAHLFALWPLPVLVVFHVLGVYFF